MSTSEATERTPMVRALASDLDWMTAPDYTPDEWPVRRPLAPPVSERGQTPEAAPAPDREPGLAPGPALTPLVPCSERTLAHPAEPALVGSPGVLRSVPVPPADRQAPTPPAARHDLDPSQRAAESPERRAPWHEPRPELSAARLLRQPGRRPGWGFPARRGTSGREGEDKLRAIRTPLRRSHRVAVVGLKGGVGKTSVTIGLGSTLAALRKDRIAAFDANPDTGTLGRRVPADTPADVRDLLRHLPHLRTYMDVRPYTRRTAEGLEVLANGPDPETSSLLADSEYRSVMDLLCGAFPLVLTDTGTGLLAGGLHGVLDLADQLVLCATPSMDAAHSAGIVLDWLQAHGRANLAEQAVMAISALRDSGRVVRVEEMASHFETRCRGVCVIPYDRHLSTGGELRLAELRPRTRAAFVDLAAMVGEGMNRTDAHT